MSSQDYIDLRERLHMERYKIISINSNAKRVGDSFSIVATVVLEKDEERITLKSSEADFIMYLAELRGMVGADGEYEFKHIKDMKQYDADLEHLIDIDKNKLKNAVDDLKSKKFEFTYNAPKMIDELLKNRTNVRNKKYLPLKRDYHHILASAMLESKAMLKARDAIIKKYPQTQKIVDATEGIFLKSFRPTGNALKDYKFYKKYVNFDIDDLGNRMSAQLIVADDTVKDFVKRSKIDAHIAIPKMMNIYGRFLEILTPMINLVRIGLELRRGNPSPDKNCILAKNIEALKSDQEYGPLFGCLDEQIRYSDAHASIRIDKATRKVFLIDARSGVKKIVRVYTFDELADMINTMQNEFFPVIYPTLVIFDIAMLDLLLVSREYKHLLLALGNY